MPILFHMATNARDMGPLALAVAGELRAEIARQNLTLKQVVAESHMPHSTASKSLNGKRMIDVEELAQLSKAIGISPAEIMRRASASLATNVTPIRPNVSRETEHDLQTVDIPDDAAAATDQTSVNPDRETP